MKKIKEFFKRIYIIDSVKTYKQMLVTWCFLCIMYLLCLIWYYTIKQIPILESLNNAYFLFGFVLNTLIKLVVTVAIMVTIFLIPSVLFYHLMITIPEKREEKRIEKLKKTAEILEKELQEEFIKRRESIRHANNRKTESINN